MFVNYILYNLSKKNINILLKRLFVKQLDYTFHFRLRLFVKQLDYTFFFLIKKKPIVVKKNPSVYIIFSRTQVYYLMKTERMCLLKKFEKIPSKNYIEKIITINDNLFLCIPPLVK